MDIAARQKVIKEMENRGYSVTDESGVLMFLGKFDRIDESMADIKKNLESLNFQGSWGTRGYPKGYKPVSRPVENPVEKPVDDSDDEPVEDFVEEADDNSMDDSDDMLNADPDSFTQLSFDGLF